MHKYKIKDLAERLQKEEKELKNKMLFMWTKQEVINLKEYNELVKLILSGVRLSLFNEVYDKFVECEDDNEFTQYLNEKTNEA